MKIGRKFVFALNATSFMLLNRYRYPLKLEVNIKFLDNVYEVLGTFYGVGNAVNIFDLKVLETGIQNFCLEVLSMLRNINIYCMRNHCLQF